VRPVLGGGPLGSAVSGPVRIGVRTASAFGTIPHGRVRPGLRSRRVRPTSAAAEHPLGGLWDFLAVLSCCQDFSLAQTLRRSCSNGLNTRTGSAFRFIPTRPVRQGFEMGPRPNLVRELCLLVTGKCGISPLRLNRGTKKNNIILPFWAQNWPLKFIICAE
jgi:hypothetical protein